MRLKYKVSMARPRNFMDSKFPHFDKETLHVPTTCRLEHREISLYFIHL